MKSIAFSSRWHSLSLLVLLTFVSAIPHNIPRLSVFDHKSLGDPSDTIPAFVWEDLETYFYNQTLDHFNYNPQSYATFKQRYAINSKYWGGANESAPIFVYLGAEAPIDGDIQFIGFLPENAPNFKALIVYIEAQASAAQAIADYAEVILYLKENLSVQNSPVIVIGGSYGGNFQEVSESCYKTIKQSCPLSDSFELKEYLDGLYSGAAQYDRPPRYPVTVVCGGIAGAPNGTDILGRIFAGVVAARVNRSCYINEHYNYSDGPYGDWDWQVNSSTTHHDGFIHQILTAKANREFQISIMEVPSRLVFLLVSLLSLVFSLSDSATVVVDGVSEWKNPTVHIGDSIIFKHKYDYKLYIFQNRGAFNLCNSTQSSLLTKPNSNSFTWHPSRTGIFYFSFNNGTLKSCQSAQKLAITVSLSPPQNSATSPALSPAASPAPSSGGIVSSSPAYPWPFPLSPRLDFRSFW
ncbi:unnamed protein product [Camellia sinensis]